MASNVNLMADVTSLPNFKKGNVHLPVGKSTPVAFQGKCTITGGDLIQNILYVTDFKYKLL